MITINNTGNFKSLLFLIWACIYCNHVGFSQNNTFCGIKNKSTLSGEQLSYKVFYKVGGAKVGAAEVVFTNQLVHYKNKDVFHFTGKGKTLRSYDWFFKVRDVYESYVDTNNMLPLKFIRDVQEGEIRIYNSAIFNHSLNQAVSSNGVFKIGNCTQDVLSAIYYARNIDFERYRINEKIPFSMFLDDETYSIYLRYLGKEQITTPYGKYNTLKFSPLLIEGTIFSGGEEMIVYVSDDTNKIPVMVETPILAGKIVVYLTSYKNARNPTKAFLKK